jgi:hypothetical protein
MMFCVTCLCARAPPREGAGISGDMSMGRVVGVARVGDPSRELERVVARPELRVLRF